MPGNPQFGNPLRLSLFDNFDFFTESTLKTAIRVEIEKYEPRVTLLDVKIDLMQEYNRVLVEVIYTINLNNGVTQDSLILPFSANDMTYLSGRTTSTI
jgi:phage baseplate assembly protein W